MKMDEMNKWLEARGYAVQRTYYFNTGTQLSEYTFRISRDGHEMDRIFVYEDELSKTALNKKQREFLLSLDWDFESAVNPSHIRSIPEIKKVIFSAPATIILWKDGTKTVVKCSENDTYSPEMGMAMAICKKALGNKGNYSKVFKKWLPEEEENIIYEPKFGSTIDEMKTSLQTAMYRLFGLGGEDDG